MGLPPIVRRLTFRQAEREFAHRAAAFVVPTYRVQVHLHPVQRRRSPVAAPLGPEVTMARSCPCCGIEVREQVDWCPLCSTRLVLPREVRLLSWTVIALEVLILAIVGD